MCLHRCPQCAHRLYICLQERPQSAPCVSNLTISLPTDHEAGRAQDSHQVKRIFSSAPRDPRYHMLSYLSSKFYQEPQPHLNEPRAALFLNRFTRTSTIMYVTSGVRDVLGLEPDQINGKSFYYCIDESCLQESLKCLESAKANDSIAYLRFRYRNPLQNPSRTHSVAMSDMSESSEDEDGGVAVPDSRSSGSMRDSVTPQPNGGAQLVDGVHSSDSVPRLNGNGVGPGPAPETNGVDGINGHNGNGSLHAPSASNGRSSSDQSMDQDARAAREAVFDSPDGMTSHSLSTNTTPDEDPAIELEAVISCTSDGLVVILRRARPLVPEIMGEANSPSYGNGLFASPWATDPSMPSSISQTSVMPNVGFPAMSDPAEAGFMAAIRDVAVFAWSLTGINGSLAQYSKGKPVDDATPPGGLPVWDPNATEGLYEDYNGFSGSRHRPYHGMGDPAGERQAGQADGMADSSTSSDDEVVWKVRSYLLSQLHHDANYSVQRATTMAPWRRPKRRAHEDAFGEESANDADGESTNGRQKKTKSGA